MNPRQSFIPEPPQASLRKPLQLSGVRILYKRGIRRITLQRLICSRLCQKGTKSTLDEILVLYDNLLHLETLSLRDKGFRKRFGKNLESLSILLSNSRISENLTHTKMKNFIKTMRKVLTKDWFIPDRNIPLVEYHLRLAFKITPTKLPGVPQRQLPPKRWIGVGYRDKGTLRNQAKDGSPSWQEVAMSIKVLDLPKS
jgi:hypothetical protein